MSEGGLGVRVVDARLALPALTGWLAAAGLIGVPGAAPTVALVALVLVVGAAIAVTPHRILGSDAPTTGAPQSRAGSALAASIPSLAALAVVAAAVALAAPARTPPTLAEALEGGTPVDVVIELEQTLTPAPGWGRSARALIVAVEIPEKAASATTQVPVRLLGVSVTERLPLGTRLAATVRLNPVEQGDDRVALARLIGDWQPRSAPSPLLARADQLRAGFLDLMRPFEGDGADLLPGLAIGDTTAVGDDLDAAMKRSALSHLTAVSGANCAIVVGLVLGIGTLARWRRSVRVGVALVALGGFVVLVTPEPSVVRAAVMSAVVLLALASGRPARGLPVLGVAVLGIIVLDPWIAREYGFTLSVLATAALLVLAGPIAQRLTRVMPAPLALGIAVPLAAQLACQPVLIMLAPEVPLGGVLANILAAPAAPVATIVGMIACLLAPLVPPLATVVAAVAWLPSAWIAGVARVTSGVPGALLPWPQGLGGALLLGALTVLGLVAVGVPTRLGTAAIRRRLGQLLAAVLVVTLAATAGVSALRALGRPADWVIAQCDVAQGDAVLVRSAGQVALIDTGAHDELLRDCLTTLGIERIHLLVLTHFDLDHVGAVNVVVGRVERAIVGPTGRDADEAVVDALRAGGAVVDTVADGERGMLGHCPWRVQWPPAHRGVQPGNDASLVLHWPQTAHCVSLFALGDLGEQTQRLLSARYPPTPVDVVKVSHHGSPDQLLDLYQASASRIALIGVGADNGYGHPAPALVSELLKQGARLGRSDEHGLVLIAHRPDGLLLWRERGGDQAEVGEPN